MLLRNLSHAHIVAYKTSFVDKGELIIIMEFVKVSAYPCSFLITNFYLHKVGDLAYHVKKMRQKNEHFTESVIMQWFV